MIKAKRFGRVLAAAVLLPCMAVTTVTAAPSTDELEQQRKEAENEVQDLQAELAELLNKVAEMEEQLIATGEKITQTQQDLEEAQAKADAQYDDMKIRIKYMYEDGSSDMWEALLTAEDFSDFLNKAEYISTVHSYDRQKLEELQQTQQEIADLKETLVAEQKTLEEQQADYQAEEESVNAELEAKRAEVEDFDVQLQAAAEAAAAEAAAREAEQAATSDSSSTAASASGGQSTSLGGSGGGSSSSSGSTGSGGSGSSSSSGSGSTGGSSSGSGSSGTSSGDVSVAQAIVNAAYSQLVRDIQRRCISRPGDRKRGVQPAGRALRVRRDDSGRRTGLLRTGAVLSCSRGNLTSQDIRRAGRKRCCRDGSSAGRYRVLQRTRGNLHRRRADDSCTPDGGRGENRECVRFAVVQTVLVIKRMQRTVSETAP